MSRRATGEKHVAWPLKVFAAGAVLVAAATAYGQVTNRGEAGDGSATTPAVERTRSRRVAGPDPNWTFAPFPMSYEITYAVTTTGARTIEVLRAVAPFDSRVENRSASALLQSERETSFGILATRSGNGAPTVLQVPPSISGPRLAEAVLSAEPLGLVERREVRSVAGRRCQVWRTSDVGGATAFLRPAPGNFIDLCVGEDGLLLEEWQVSGGRGVRHRVARDVRVGAVDTATLHVLPQDGALAVDAGGGSNMRIGDDERPVGPFLEAPGPPEGFERFGRYRVVPPQPGLRVGGDRGKVRAATVDVYVRGADAVTIEQGGVLDLSDPWRVESAFPDVDLGSSIGTGELVPGRLGNEVRALLGSGRYVRVSGTVPLDDLVTLARSLNRTDNGTGIGFGN